jgi:hypothetical protein
VIFWGSIQESKLYHNVVYSIPCYRQDLKKNHKFDHKMVNRESTPFYRQEIKNHKIITNSCIEYTLQHAGIKKKHKLYNNQRLPGACNRSPGSKLLSITTQLHCGSHLGGRARLPDTILEEDHPMTIPSKFGSN